MPRNWPARKKPNVNANSCEGKPKQSRPQQKQIRKQNQMILGIVQAMSNWLVAKALPEEVQSAPDPDDEGDFDDGSPFVDGTFSNPRKPLH